jgi:hypothetical protein
MTGIRRTGGTCFFRRPARTLARRSVSGPDNRPPRLAMADNQSLEPPSR